MVSKIDRQRWRGDVARCLWLSWLVTIPVVVELRASADDQPATMPARKPATSAVPIFDRTRPYWPAAMAREVPKNSFRIATSSRYFRGSFIRGLSRLPYGHIVAGLAYDQSSEEVGSELEREGQLMLGYHSQSNVFLFPHLVVMSGLSAVQNQETVDCCHYAATFRYGIGVSINFSRNFQLMATEYHRWQFFRLNRYRREKETITGFQLSF